MQSGAYGSGKTMTNAWIILRESLQYPDNLGLAGAETYPQLRETLQSDFDTLISAYLDAGLVKYHGTERKYTFWNGSQVLFWPLVGADARRQRHRIRSLNLGWALIEEATSIPEATTLEVMGRLRRRNTSRRLYGSCNPDSPSHYLYVWFVDENRPGHRLVKSNTYNNPFLPPDYIRSLESSLGPEMASRYLRGEWVNFEGLVYRDFDRDAHIIPAFDLKGLTPEGRRIVHRWRALDFGGANPHALLWFAEDDAGQVYVTGEWFKAQVGLDEVAGALNSDPVGEIYRDHDVADSITLEKAYEVRGLKPARKEKMPGIATVQQFLKPAAPGYPPRLRIFDTCKNLIREIGRYKWPEGTDKRDPGNEPVKKDDHALDALRYGLHTRYFKPVATRRPGGYATPAPR
nr:phage terminase large subunit [Deinococcus sp. 6GRE01]